MYMVRNTLFLIGPETEKKSEEENNKIKLIKNAIKVIIKGRKEGKQRKNLPATFSPYL